MDKKNVKNKDKDEIIIPEEHKSFLKRLSSPGYLLLHPEKTKKAIILTVLLNFLYIMVGGLIAGYIAAEIAVFLAFT